MYRKPLNAAKTEKFVPIKGLLDREGNLFTIDFISEVRIEIVDNDDVVDTVVDTIIATAKTGTSGDKKLFVIPVSRAVRIRTDEENEATLKVEAPATLSDPSKNNGSVLDYIFTCWAV